MIWTLAIWTVSWNSKKFCFVPGQGCSSPTFCTLWGSEFITYLLKCLTQTPFNKNYSNKYICGETILNAEHNKGTAMVCMNISAAFYTINHTILKTVMENYFWHKDTALQWLSSYLSNRQFSLQIGNNFSPTHTINFSFPQGSILGSVLFNSYVSTLPEVIKQTTDTTISEIADAMCFQTSLDPKGYTSKRPLQRKKLIK